MSPGRCCLGGLAMALALVACSDESATFRVGAYPGAQPEIDSPTRTLASGNGLTFLVDDELGCVQATDSNGLASACVSMHRKVTASEFGMWRQDDKVIAVVVSSEPDSVATSRLATWYLSGSDGPTTVVDAVEVADHVYVTAMRSPVDVPMWGVQLRTTDGRLTVLQPLVGQFLSAPR